VCRACMAGRLQGVADAGQGSEERQAALAILDALDADGGAAELDCGFYVSRSWLACARAPRGPPLSCTLRAC